MELLFNKFQGTGNDFVIIDNRHQILSKKDTNLINSLCKRKFGIGADGLILLEEPDNPGDDFKMVYFNADGRESSMCGNGGRCIVAFAASLGIVTGKAVFSAIDGYHEAVIENDLVGLRMSNVSEVKQHTEFTFLNTGSPHHVIFTEGVGQLDVVKDGAAVRFSEEYKDKGGTNVNFAEEIAENTFQVRTYERGVEDETLSCGTGVTAVAIAAHKRGLTTENTVHLQTPGGALTVSFEPSEEGYREIWLTGPAKMVFKGSIVC